MAWLHSLQTHTENRSSLFSSWFRSASPAPSTSAASRVSPEATEEITATINEMKINETESSEDQEEQVKHNYVEPALYSWFYKLRAAVLSKLTLYFHQVILAHATPEDMKANCAKLANDIPGK